MRRPLPLLILLAALSACAKTQDPTECQATSQCAAGCRCNSGVCTADARPVAAVRAIGAVEAFALVELDGSASRDPDPGDAVADHAWTVRAVDAECQPPEIASRGPKPYVRFGCPGRYEVSLAVRDSLGLESDVATQEVRVVPATGLSRVEAGPDLATEHVCGGTRLGCVTESPVALLANPTPGLSVRWSVLPPSDRPLDSTRHVRFLPDANAADPVAVIETDGSAISGDWVFVVEAYDAYGVVGAAYTRVSVRNRPPVVAISQAVPFPHVFDPGRSVFVSSGSLGWSVVDPDGDPVEVSPTWRHVGDGDATFDGAITSTMVSFSTQVTYAGPEDALRLRGGSDLSRRIELVVRDPNGGEGSTAADIEIGNRPPVWVGGSVDTQVPHRFDRLGSRYVATVRAGSFVDPDGDPIAGGSTDSTGPCATATADGGDVIVECSAPYAGNPAALATFVGPQTFTVPVRDPWDAVAAARVQTVQILNSAPGLWGAPSVASVSCRATSEGSDPQVTVAGAAFDVVPGVFDPDGDPVVVTPRVLLAGGSASPASALFTGTEAALFHFVQPSLSWIPRSASASPVSFLVASDGATTVQAAVSPAVGYCASPF